ncbi:CMGC family protein kinase [Trichomonas vaginalis G3]|uniref:CMGC family protein kinase n=1 Tax=Trichomonas vaginalis (strain ATCC PRA-98 / G3) TaxID=412133 RepID=A2EW38_TRIV3|nr:STKc MOK domain-containing protein [Trichomonas vaginalis G3]EAY03124.1 CMGC family protein kinase [Trichomonas vaginalis G3]KAI5508299.1 STKc MOK domain-containing protein [Trichomonas vaginalis G3]|eukprot:XP_001315347.1 CMGC family protein kinase [Trichomonas vaginalis G3]
MEKKELFGPDWRIINKLGEGSFSEVFKVKSMKNQQFYAIKMLKKRFRSVEEVTRLPEIMCLRALEGNPNIIRLEEVLFDSKHNCLALVFELLDENLFELMRDHKQPFDEKTSLLIIYQLLKALSIMHAKNLFHRDIKPENCMINKDTYELKLADFGSARTTSDTGPFTEYVATRWYRAPECILTSGSYGPAVDIWAVGCILYEILTTRPLFPGKHQLDQIARIHNILGTPGREVLSQFKQNPNSQINYAFPHRVPQGFRSLLPNASEGIIDLLSKLLVYDPNGRISANEALQHPVFENIRKQERNYIASHTNIPFSAFVMMNQSHTTIKNNVDVSPVYQDPSPLGTPITFIQQAVMSQVEEQKSDSNLGVEFLNNQNQKPNNAVPSKSILAESKPVAPSNLSDSRRMTIERIKIYNQQHPAKMSHAQNRKVAQPSLHFGMPKVVKPTVLPQIRVNPYQKPSADVIKPRMQGVKIRFDL